MLRIIFWLDQVFTTRKNHDSEKLNVQKKKKKNHPNLHSKLAWTSRQPKLLHFWCTGSFAFDRWQRWHIQLLFQICWWVFYVHNLGSTSDFIKRLGFLKEHLVSFHQTHLIDFRSACVVILNINNLNENEKEKTSHSMDDKATSYPFEEAGLKQDKGYPNKKIHHPPSMYHSNCLWSMGLYAWPSPAGLWQHPCRWRRNTNRPSHSLL